MSKHRAITGFGPLTFLTTAQVAAGAGSAWIRFGPFVGNQLAYQNIFSGASTAGQTAKVQGTLTTASTAGVVTLVTRNSTQKTMAKSTSTLVFAFIRFASTALNAARTVTHIVAAVP